MQGGFFHYQIDLQALEHARKLGISLRDCTEVVPVYVHAADLAELVGAEVFKTVSACDTEQRCRIDRIRRELLLHYGVHRLKLPHGVKAHVLFVGRSCY